MKRKTYTQKTTTQLVLYFSVILFMLSSCHQQPSTPDLTQALATYDRLILKTDADSIALLYTPDGDLGTMAHGRDSIRKFLLHFKDFKVLGQHSTIDSQLVKLDTGFLFGHYYQKVIVPVRDSINVKHIYDTVSVNGTFSSVWIRLPEYGWRIKSMETASK